MLGQGWSSQWDRVGRRLADVRTVYAGAPGGTDAAIDAVLSFFEAVHHLKDWLTNDQESGVQTTDVHGLINGSPTLKLCADLANGAKHFKLDPNRRARTGDHSTTVAQNDVVVFVGTGASAHRFRTASGGTTRDVLEVAEEAVSEWRDFLSSRNLI
ncbi:hypothetical protein ACFU3E_12640 [Streptomyces sp. NPDC057424]|uniref:hypothetical protein n=1 Tax=Streptomyces sp. NPDC057424 TaxID=3346127 RepID=UPI003695E411